MRVERNRCSSCGYMHVGPAPEHCPVCGAPQSAFNPYSTKATLAGTRTAQNLMEAFAGESQANRRYTLFRHIAELEGAPASALASFDKAAEEETAHALGHLGYLSAFGDTRTNLAAAACGEDDEASSMYPGFAAIAEEEGLDEIAQYFRSLARYEGKHRDAFKAAVEEIGTE